MAALHEHQWKVVCTICESTVEFYCNTCGDNLCSKCKANHLKSQASKHHSIVPCMEGVEHRKQPYVVCAIHGEQKCEFWCQTCDKAICSTCITSSKHVGHTFGNLGDKIQEKKALMARQIKTLGISLVAWKKKLEDAKNIKSGYSDEVDALDKQLTSAADKLHADVKTLLAQSRKELQSMRLSDLSFLQSQGSNLTHGISNIQDEIKEIEETLRSGDTAKMLEYSLGEDDDLSAPDLITVSLPDFESELPNTDRLTEIFGRISTGSSNPQKYTDVSLSTDPKEADENNNDQNKGFEKSEVQRASKQMSIMIAPSIVNILNATDLSANTLVCYGEDHALVRTKDRNNYTTTNALHLTDKYGSVTEVLDHKDAWIADVALTEHSNIMFTNSTGRCVMMRSKSGDITTLFHTLWKPDKIFCMQSGNVLLSIDSNPPRVIQYNRRGKVIMEVEITEDWNMCKTVKDMGENKVNNNIYACGTWGGKMYGSSPEKRGKLFAFESNGKQRYQYPGTSKEETEFYPVCVRSDRMGHVIIADGVSVSVHILDKDGEFLQYLMTKEEGLTRITVIDVDGEGHCWIRNCPKEKSDESWYNRYHSNEDGGEILIVQYMK